METPQSRSFASIPRRRWSAHIGRRYAEQTRTIAGKELVALDKSVDGRKFVGYASKLCDRAIKKSDRTLGLQDLETPAGQNLH